MNTQINGLRPEDVPAALADGRQALDTEPGRAAEQARAVLAVSPRSADAFRLLGAALRRLGDNDAANEAELAAITASGSDPDLIRAGQALLAGDLQTAEPILRRVLNHRPDDAAAIRMLGEVAAEVGLLRDAERLFRRSLELAPGFDYARLHLAVALNSGNRSGEALAEIERISGEMRDYSEVRSLHAAILGRVGDYERAIELYRANLAEEPDNLQLLLSVAYLQQIVGNLDDSIATYRSALEVSPTAGEAWWSLANLKTFRFADDDIAAMEAALAAPGLSDDDRLQIHFALGKAFEDRGEDERAFRQYEQGNTLRWAKLNYRPEAVTALVEATERLFTREFVAQRADAGFNAPDPIFILGLPRSGSTLVEQILASHPAIEGTAELADIIVLARGLEPDERRGEEAWQAYPQILAELPSSELERLGRLYLERTRIQRKTDRPHFIDKMPNNWIHTGFIRLILPNAKIIDTRRHPLACGFSNFKQHYARGQEFAYDLNNFGQYYRDYVRLMRHFDEVAPGTVHRVIHERLIANPEAEIRLLLDYLGLPFDEACLNFHETKRPIRTASSEQVRRPISGDSADQWRRFEQWLEPLKAGLGPALEHWAD
jgi:tetratricopeptide (TPR) repeat protein